MAESGEVALFIDFENIRYGLKNIYGVEPDPPKLMEKARKYGPVAVANAYADFTEHPEFYRRKLEVAGITPRDIPRRSPDVAHKSSADMAMLIDIIDCLLDRPTVNTIVLMTGDSDFIRAVARARHRFGKKVVIAGVPGCVSNDLIAAANASDPIYEEGWTPLVRETFESSTNTLILEASPVPALAEAHMIKLIDYLAQTRPYLTFLFVKTHALSPTNNMNLTPLQVDTILTGFKQRGILVEELKQVDGRTLRLLNYVSEHPEAKQLREQLITSNAPGSLSAPNGMNGLTATS